MPLFVELPGGVPGRVVDAPLVFLSTVNTKANKRYRVAAAAALLAASLCAPTGQRA